MPFPLAELVAGTVEKAAAYLAERRFTVRAGGRTWSEKQADWLSDALSGLGGAVKAHPVLGKALIGGGLGAAAGGASHYLGGDEADPRNKRRGVLSSALTGGLAGAALGGGVGLVQKGLAGHGSSDGGGPKGGTPGVGEFTHNGQRYRIDPKAIQNNPELLQQALSASSGPGLMEGALPAAVRAYWNNPIAPLSARALPLVGAADYIWSRGRTKVEDLQSGLRQMLGNQAAHPQAVSNADAFQQLVGSDRALRDVFHGSGGPRGLPSTAPLHSRMFRGARLAGNDFVNIFRRAFGGAREDYVTGSGQRIGQSTLNEAGRMGRTARLGQKLTLPRIGGRALAYGSAPLLEWGVNSLASEHAKADQIREMMRQHTHHIGPA